MRYDLGTVADTLTRYCDEQDNRVKPLLETLILRVDGVLSTLAPYSDDPEVARAISAAREARDLASGILSGWLGDYTRTGRSLVQEIRDA